MSSYAIRFTPDLAMRIVENFADAARVGITQARGRYWRVAKNIVSSMMMVADMDANAGIPKVGLRQSILPFVMPLEFRKRIELIHCGWQISTHSVPCA